MATKKRKVDEEYDLLSSGSNHAAGGPLPQHRPVVYTPAPAAEDDDDGSDAEEEEVDVGKLVAPLSTEQHISLLRFAAASSPAVLAEICRVAESDTVNRKLFVHGLGWDTTSEGLRSAFARYGEMDDCRVVVDKATGRSKGYGFLLFRHARSARRALRCPQKMIDNRMTSCQLASSGPSAANAGGSQHHHHSQNPNPGPAPPAQPDNLRRKIYVGNVHSDIDGARLLNFFAQFGEIEEGPIGFDRQTGKPKGYALFVYKTEEGAQKALKDQSKNFEGHQLFCQKATESKVKGGAAGNAALAAHQGMEAFNGSGGFGGPAQDMGLAQQAIAFGQGFLGMTGPQAFGQGMQPNAAAITMLAAAAAQNPAAFGINPAMLAALNPTLAAAFGAAGSQQGVAPSGVLQAPAVQNYGMGNMGFQTPSGFQAPLVFQGPPAFQGHSGFQGSPGLQGPPGFQGPPAFPSAQPVNQQGVSGSGGSYQVAAMGTSPMPKAPTGVMGGYGTH